MKKLRNVFVWLSIILFLGSTRILCVQGISMEPTLHSGTIHFGIRTYQVERGDIITVYSEASDCYVIKRVVAIEGDTVEYTKDYVAVNGTTIMGDRPEVFIRVTVSPHCVFLLGDNYGLSFDSRYYGEVELPNSWFTLIK